MSYPEIEMAELKEDENGSPKVEDPRFELYTGEYLERFAAKYPEFTSEQVKKTIPFCEELAIERIKREDLADNDPLTDLLNKRGLRRYVGQRLQQYHREVRDGSRKLSETKASLLYLDLDHFKIVNDTYNHATGDEVLVAFSELLRKSLRPSDIVSRWGGEEFAVFLDSTGGEGAIAVADRFRSDTSDVFHELFPHLDWPKTVSCGIYQFPSLTEDMLASEENRESLINQSIHYADVAHYKGAKQAGRNKVGVMLPSGRIYTAALLNSQGETPKITYQIP